MSGALLRRTLGHMRRVVSCGRGAERSMSSSSPTSPQSSSSTSQYSYIVVDRLQAVATIGINRPEKRNCVDPQVAAELNDALVCFEQDADARVAVLHGCGGTFCSGFDLGWAAQAATDAGGEFKLPHAPMGPTWRVWSKPLIAAIDGFAVAGGLELALMCDLRVVDETAVLGVLNRRFGVPLVDGGTARLSAMIGLSRALDLTLTGRHLSASEAFAWGLANRLSPCGAVLGQAVRLADEISQLPQRSLLADRRAIYHAAYDATSLQHALNYEHEHAQPTLHEAMDGARRFAAGDGRHGKAVFDKWTPKWRDDPPPSSNSS